MAANNRAKRKTAGTVRAFGMLAVLVAVAAMAYWYNKTSNQAPAVKVTPAAVSGLQKFSTKCKFTEGDRAGQTVDFAPHAPLPVGGDCNDGTSSSGVVVE